MRPLLYSLFGIAKPTPPKEKPPVRETGSLTLREGFAKYLKEVSPHKKRGAPQDTSLVRAWLKTPVADWEMYDITGKELADLRDAWLKTYKPATVVRRLAILSHLYSTASTEWYYRKLENPVKQIRKPKVRNSRERRLYRDIRLDGFPSSEFDWLIKAYDSKYVEPLITLAVETAMRRGEIASLLWENVNLEACTAFLPDTKNGHDRTVPLSPKAVEVLRAWQQDEESGRVFKCGDSYITKVFMHAVRSSRAHYERACEVLGVRPDPKHFNDLRFHDLRHEAISTMAPHFHAHELAKISGHRDTRMLMRYYHPDPTDLASRLAAM